MYYCPYCGNLLFCKHGTEGVSVGNLVFECLLCPIAFPVTKPIRIRTYMQRTKAEDAVYSDAQAFENCQQTTEKCPKCDHSRAYFLQIQTRSADEPMTIFYRCADHNCKHIWRE